MWTDLQTGVLEEFTSRDNMRGDIEGFSYLLATTPKAEKLDLEKLLQEATRAYAGYRFRGEATTGIEAYQRKLQKELKQKRARSVARQRAMPQRLCAFCGMPLQLTVANMARKKFCSHSCNDKNWRAHRC